MKNAFVTEVRLPSSRPAWLLPQIWPAIFEAQRPTKLGNVTSALTITLKAALQVGNMLKYYLVSRHRTQSIVSTGDPKEIVLARIVRRGERVARS
jgi:hypothetical protein